MQPLDLSKKSPRSPWEQLAGLYMLPRTIDKMRALLPGGNIGPYKIDGFSVRMLSMIGVPVEALQAEVTRANSDEEIAQWVLARSDEAARQEANRALSTRNVADLEPEARERFARSYPRHAETPSGVMFDVMVADDDAMFGKR